MTIDALPCDEAWLDSWQSYLLWVPEAGGGEEREMKGREIPVYDSRCTCGASDREQRLKVRRLWRKLLSDGCHKVGSGKLTSGLVVGFSQRGWEFQMPWFGELGALRIGAWLSYDLNSFSDFCLLSTLNRID